MDTRIQDYSPFFSTETQGIYKGSPETQRVYKASIPKDQQTLLDYGLPNPLQFPVTKATFTTRDDSEITITPEEMETTLQYGGFPELTTWVQGLYKRVHTPPTLDDKKLPSSLAFHMMSGGREGVSKALRLLAKEGDSVLGEHVTYQTFVTMISPRGIKGVPLRSDGEGLDVGQLTQVMSEWDETTQGRRPRLLYCVPSCSNPTGVTWSVKRRQLVYEAARRFNLLILEDDPYYHMQFQRPLTPSLLSIDTDGRVLRADSFSKTLSPGIRVGILAAPSQLVEKIHSMILSDTGGPSKLAQMMIYKVVQDWGYDRYLQHTDLVAEFYKKRCDQMLNAMDKYLKGLCEWRRPDGGMFVWVRVLGVDDCDDLNDVLSRKGIFFVKGSVFTMERTKCAYFRVSFPLATDQDIERGISVFAETLKERVQNGQ